MLKSLKFMAVLSLLVVCPTLIGLGWWQRDYLLGWYLTRNLLHAQGPEKNSCLESLARLGENAQFPLLDHLDQAQPTQARDLVQALAKLIDSWGGLSSPPSSRCLSRLTLRFSGFSNSAQAEVLRQVFAWIPRDQPEKSLPLLGESTRLMLGEAIHRGNPEAMEPALEIARKLAPVASNEMKTRLHEVTRHVLDKGSSELKIKAIQWTLVNGIGEIPQIANCLQDRSAEVRRAAMIACAPALEQVSVDNLLPSLHDADPETRSLCEAALIARGLKPEQIRLGKLLTDPAATRRLQVLDSLLEDPDIDASVWLRKLSHDPSPAVRVAALRVMSNLETVDLSDRMDQMARSDPNQTVAILADYYLRSTRLRSR
ncbi:MAG: hypothetical protein EXR99_07215 [Gemmataceae bacterium]|nr:hypothetical protein [Gemmataceae bacterium]